jgi:hypothetical protein
VSAIPSSVLISTHSDTANESYHIASLGKALLQIYSLLRQNVSHSLSSMRQIIRTWPLKARQWNFKLQKQTSNIDQSEICLGSVFQPGSVSHCFRNLHAFPFREQQNGTERGGSKMEEQNYRIWIRAKYWQITQYVIQWYVYHGANLAFNFRHLYL